MATLDPERMLTEFAGLLETVQAGGSVDTGPLRARLVASSDQVDALARQSADGAAFGSLVDFQGLLVAALDFLDVGDADGATVAFRRALHQSMRGGPPPDLERE